MQMVPIVQFLLVAAFLFQGFFSSNAKRYDLPAGWTITNSASLGSSSGYRILNASESEQIVSDNGRFSLAFYDPQGTGDFYLSVLLNVPQPSKVVQIWAANVNSSVSDGATLMLTKSHRKFILLDANPGGSLKWSTGPAVGITAVELQESGNLVFYNESEVVWESFKQPLDVLVPGQKLTSSMSITSMNISSTTSMQPGQFIGTMEASGFVLYIIPHSEATMANMLREPQPYLAWSINHQRPSILESARTACAAQQATMSFTGNTIEISYSSNAACGGPLLVDVKQEAESKTSRYLKLQEDGDLVVFEYDNKTESWNAVYHALDGICKSPTSCGSYGICSSSSSSSNGKPGCRCIGDTKLEDLPTESRLCGPPGGVSTSCLANEAQNHHLVEIPGATYFSNAFLQPDMIKASKDDCLNFCVSNCSCAAAFYKQNDGSCFLIEELMGSLSNGPEDSTAYIKIQNQKLVTSSSSSTRSKNGGTSKSARTAIVFLVVICVGLLITLVAVILIVKTKYPHAYNKIVRR